MHNNENDKRELATNRLLEVLREEKVEDIDVEKKIQEIEEKDTEPEEKPEQRDFRTKIIDFFQNFIDKLNPVETGLVGIDIGSYSIKAVYLEKQKEKYLVKDFKLLNIDLGSTNKKQEVIKNLLELKIPENYAVNTCVYGEKVLLKKVIVPKLAKKEQVSAIEWNAKKDLTFPADAALIDYRIVNQFQDKGVEKVTALVAIAEKSVINEHLDTLNAAGISTRAISPKSAAIFNSYKELFEGKDIDDGIVIDIGATVSYILFVNEGTLQFARELKTGGDDINKGMEGSISTNTGVVKINEEMAERLKIKYGIPEEHSNEVTEEGIPVSQIGFIIRPSLEKLLSQIQRSIDYYRSKFSYDEAEKVYLSGGTALIKNIVPYFADGLQKDVELINPFKNIEISEEIDKEEVERLAPELVVAFGAAIEKTDALSLLPQEIKEIPVRKKQFKYTAFAAALSVFVILTFSFILNFSLSKYKNVLNETKTISPQTDSKKSEFRKLITRRQNLQAKLDNLKQEISKVSGSNEILGVLKILSGITPEHISINKVEVERGEQELILKLFGIVEKQGWNNEVLLTGFMVDLKNTGYFSKIFPYEDITKNPNTKSLQFEIRCQL